MPQQTKITGIAAVARNGVIGVDGRLPWHISEDMRHFRQTTMGGALIMGRLTYQSFSRPLPGRTSIVVSRQPPSASSETAVVWVTSLDQALQAARATARPIFVAGGAQIYAAAWSLLTDLDITLVDAAPEGDAHFPAVSALDWDETAREPHDGFTFVRYRRKDAS